MKILRIRLLVAAVLLLSFSMQACKSKKLVAKPAPVPVKEAPVEVKQPEAPVAQKPEVAPVEKADFNFSNVQFEFNSDVLKTASFEVLDKVVRELKKEPGKKLTIEGHSSIEGTASHNMSLSVDRANSVKSYLVNAGISGANLAVKGFGATKPLTSNATEEGKALNRRVEFKVN